MHQELLLSPAGEKFGRDSGGQGGGGGCLMLKDVTARECGVDGVTFKGSVARQQKGPLS